MEDKKKKLNKMLTELKNFLVILEFRILRITLKEKIWKEGLNSSMKVKNTMKTKEWVEVASSKKL